MPASSSTLYIDPRIWVVQNLTNARLQDAPGVTGGLMAVISLGWYSYDATSSAADNGTTVIKTHDIDSGDPGRFLRFAT